MSKFLSLLLLIVSITNPIFAQHKQIIKPDGSKIATETIDKMITRLMDTAEVTGLCLGIINENKISYIKAYGYKNKAKHELNDTATCFYAASLAKSLFACIVMQLVDSQMINLDKPLYTYLPKPLPEYDNYKDLASDDRWKLITARHCLDHTTGFPNLRQFNPRGNKKLEIFFTPGERYAYSGEGLRLLQMAVEIITIKPLEDLAQEKVFKPLKMTRTSFLWQPAFEDNYALGYDMNEDALQKRKRVKSDAAGSMETSIADYSRFIEAVMQGKLMSPQSKNDMLSPQINIHTKRQFPSLNNDTTTANKKIQLTYGLGWGLFNSQYGKAFFKEGYDGGWVHFALNFPEKKMSVIVMCNSSNGESIFKELFEKLTGVEIPWEWENYVPYKATVKLSAETLQQFAGDYEGKIKATISLVNGRLKMASESAGLASTNLYAQNDHHFFLKVMDTEMDFVRGADGKIEKVILYDEGDHYELKKIK